MNITNFTKKELAAYEEYKNFTSGKWSKKRTAEEIIGTIALATAFALILFI